ncbi:alpha,alpha-trehalase TreF [Foetidibacter luteolus]|uniref:alpha,alpha-trehalase TreF n=1 Tax=Foetidibacter luteolus TaxID=2608880 RepID=UPI00129BAAFF|nr:alpha,alpha-trehalase TreF [Foetidibacter luteolus]
MKKIPLLFIAGMVSFYSVKAQAPPTPDKLYGELFADVQMSRIFPDGKTFVDCVPKRKPAEIVADYLKIKNNPAVRFSLKLFVEQNFELPAGTTSNYKSDKNVDVKEHITQLWQVLKRNPDKAVTGSSLLPLPNSYIVPGGRFREIYYWDSYFTMLGLQESGQTEMVENMVNNFSYLISQYGHIPNGNRTYYLSRSQPPYFALMLGLLAETNGAAVFAQYQRPLQLEYDYWMDKTSKTKHVVKMPDGSTLNRYYDQSTAPRQESHYEDVETAAAGSGYIPESTKKDGAALVKYQLICRNLRSCAETGWDFSSRWLADGKSLSTIQVTNLIPVDLNCLLYNLELTLAKAYKAGGNLLQANLYNQLAEKRKKAINKYLYNNTDGWYYDYKINDGKLSAEATIAGITPFFFNIPPHAHIARAAKMVEAHFAKPGGVVTTLKNTGQQWDAPNGWAPLQWITIKGLENYGMGALAKEIAGRWVNLNVKVYKSTGKLMEKYNVTDTNVEAGGGEYPSQDGFGWTNGVLLKLMNMYGLTGEE